jgi:hypothetical protein
LAALQRSELVQADRLCAPVDKIRIDKSRVTDLVVGVVMDILREVSIDFSQLFGVDPISVSAWNFAVWNSSQFVVLSPKVGFKKLSCRKELQNGDIAFS